jgi:hypothetical protein
LQVPSVFPEQDPPQLLPSLLQAVWPLWGAPDGTGEHVPCLPLMSHAWHEPVQAVSQQVPSGEQVVPLTHPAEADTVLQVCPRLALHAPLPSQVPAQLSVSSAFFTATQLPPGPEQVWQLPVQSLLLQHSELAMHIPLQGLKPDAHPDAAHVFEDVSHCRAVPF